MRTIVAGHRYELDSVEGSLPQTLQFIHREVLDAENLRTVHDGTTNEDVLKVLIDRMRYLNTKIACRENSLAITKLEEALMWLNKRTENRRIRGVEGTNEP